MADTKETKIKTIEVGKFYFIHDGSKTGHPGLVVWKDDDKNRYLIIRIDSDEKGEIPKDARGVRHITKLTHKTDDKIEASYVHNRPMLCKRKDIGTPASPNISFHPDDQPLIDEIAKNRPEFSPSLRPKKRKKAK